VDYKIEPVVGTTIRLSLSRNYFRQYGKLFRLREPGVTINPTQNQGLEVITNWEVQTRPGSVSTEEGRRASSCCLANNAELQEHYCVATNETKNISMLT
jgi:hypothetical protein